VFTLWFTPLSDRARCQVLGYKKPRYRGVFLRASEGTRTPDRLDHNPLVTVVDGAQRVAPAAEQYIRAAAAARQARWGAQ
jgi:hypothetical protein